LLMGSLVSRSKKEYKMVSEDFEVEKAQGEDDTKRIVNIPCEGFEVEVVVEKVQEKKEPEKLPDVVSESTKEFAQMACDKASSVDGETNLVAVMVHCCVQTILQGEIVELTKEMVEYRNVLSKKMLETPKEELDMKATFNLGRLQESFEAGWRCFKHGCGDDAAFEAFMTTMNIKFPEEDVTEEDTTQSQ